MMCFKDREFCSAPCGQTQCFRNLNEDRRQEARQWWAELPGEPPIALRDMSNGCPEFIPLPQPVE